MSVKITFTYEPDEPDDGHEVGMSEAEYEQVTDALGADNIVIEKVAS